MKSRNFYCKILQINPDSSLTAIRTQFFYLINSTNQLSSESKRKQNYLKLIEAYQFLTSLNQKNPSLRFLPPPPLSYRISWSGCSAKDY